jgi:hypothetical protein
VDKEGRLATFTLAVPAAGKFVAYRWEAAYLDYGDQLEFTKPTGGDVVEAPARVYELFT